MFLADTGNVAAKAHGVFGRTETESVRVASKIPVRVGGEQPHLVAVGAQGEAGAPWVEVRFSEDCEAVSGHRHIRDAKLFRCVEVVAQEPAADVDGGPSRI